MTRVQALSRSGKEAGPHPEGAREAGWALGSVWGTWEDRAHLPELGSTRNRAQLGGSREVS